MRTRCTGLTVPVWICRKCLLLVSELGGSPALLSLDPPICVDRQDFGYFR